MVDVQVDPLTVAREVLAGLEERLASKDLQRILGAYTDDAVVVGDEAEHWTRAAIESYLNECAEMEPVIRWTWNHVEATAYSPVAVGFLAAATMSFHGPAGELLATPEPFRMSCVVVSDEGTWRIAQYHGSRPYGR